MHLCLFEDEHANSFLPLTYFRPVYDLRCGMLSLRQRIVSFLLPKKISLFTRSYLASVVQEENPAAEVNRVSSGSCLFVNGRTIMNARLARELKKMAEDCLFVEGENLVAVRLGGENLARALSSRYGDAIDLSNIKGIRTKEVNAVLVSYPWDLVYANESELASDFTLLKKNPASKSQQVHKSAALINRRNIWIGRRANLGAGVVLDASNGPIYVENDVRIFPTAVIEGPCYIGDGTLIKIGAKVYGNTSIGSMCKVGGEVEHSILHSHCNKQHDGFLGHSYIAPWVNLGAGTTTSNLKNTYGSVRVHVNGQQVDSGKMFVGLVAGDHVKVGINGTIDTGTVIGPSSNIYGTGLFPKYIPPFSWGASSSFSTYDLERAINVASTVMSRRGVTMSDEYKKLFRYIYELTSNERASYRD